MTANNAISKILITTALAAIAVTALAETPHLNIKTKHASPREEQRKQQIERLAAQYDLKKYTLTRDIMVEEGVINHSSPVLTLNLRFLDNDDLALSAYVHEQAHWVLMERHRNDLRQLFADLEHTFPNLDYRQPQGDGTLQGSYVHIAVCVLEWQAMEELVGAERARKVIEWKQRDHYTEIYKAILNHREQAEGIMKRYGVKW